MGSMMPGGPGTMWLVLVVAVLAIAISASVWFVLTGHHADEATECGASPHHLPEQGKATAPPSDDLRASDADREKAVAALQAHTSAGRITLDELDDRVAAVYASRTIGELRRVLADLPGEQTRP